MPAPEQPGDAAYEGLSSHDGSYPEFSRDLEIKKFALEERKLELEERKLGQARTDTWTRFWVTILVGGLITGGFNYIIWQANQDAQTQARAAEKTEKERAERVEKAEKERAERGQQVQVAIELVNAREKASTDLRAKMFNALLQNYFHNATDREQIAILELIALNFRDAVQIRPMLELLDVQILVNSNSAERIALRTELRRAAHVIVKDQLEQIRQSKKGEVSRTKIAVGEAVTVPCGPNVAVRMLGAKDDSTITLQRSGADGSAEDRKFDVSYFDMPMLDYKTVRGTPPNDWRYAIVLENVMPDRKSAEIAVACLPQNYVSAERRYAFDDLLGDYLNVN